MAFTILRPHWWQAGWVFVAGMSLWLRMAFPIMAIGPASHDDMLFVRQAAEIGAGNWLGSYSSLTHAKGMAYSLFLLLNQAVGLPLKLTEHVLYLAVSLYFAATLGRLYRSRGVALAVFVLLAFVPTAWIDGVGGRVVREGLYGSLALLLLALGVRCCVLPAAEPAPGSPTVQLRQKWPALLALGAVAGLFWLTREEGAWLLPAMLVLAVYWLWRHRSTWRAWKAGLAFMALPLLACLLVLGSANALNYAFYGVFRNNDLRSGDFQAGYAALTGIRQGPLAALCAVSARCEAASLRDEFRSTRTAALFRGGGRRILAAHRLRGYGNQAMRRDPFGLVRLGAARGRGASRSLPRRQDGASLLSAARRRDRASLPRARGATACRGASPSSPPWRPSYAVDTAHAAVRVFVTLGDARKTASERGTQLGNSGAARAVSTPSLMGHWPLSQGWPFPVAGARPGTTQCAGPLLPNSQPCRAGSPRSVCRWPSRPGSCGWA